MASTALRASAPTMMARSPKPRTPVTTPATSLPRRAPGPPSTRSAQQQQRRRRQCLPSAPSRGSAVVPAALRNIAPPEALLFDCDGVLLESEAVGHRESFNAAFKEEEALKPDAHEWSEEEYGRWLKIGGGKERMTKCVACQVQTGSSASPLHGAGSSESVILLSCG